MKPGDTVQIAQFDGGVTFWIYATVLQVNQHDEGDKVITDGALVEVNHPANIEHGKQKVVKRDALRTKDDVAALLATEERLSERANLEAALERLS